MLAPLAVAAFVASVAAAPVADSPQWGSPQWNKWTPGQWRPAPNPVATATTTPAASVAAVASACSSAAVAASTGPTDVQILNYALTLEHLEDKFYREGLANFTQAQFVAAGFPDPFYKNLQQISVDETTHVSFLTTALQSIGAAPVAECTYNFGALTPASFVATASVLEGVGVSAYLGAAASIIEKAYLTAAGSILTVEARHSAFIRGALAESPFPAPFDTPLDFDEVYTLAAPFIVSCPATNPALPVKAFPSLAASASPAKAGATETLTPGTGFVAPASGVYAAFITVTGPVFTNATASGKGYSVVIPAGIAGQSYVVLTSSSTAVTDSTVIAGPAIIEVTPVYEY